MGSLIPPRVTQPGTNAGPDNSRDAEQGADSAGSLLVMTSTIHFEQDVVLTRQRARHLARLLRLDTQEQTRLATAVSEVARNAFQYAGGGRVEYFLDTEHPALLVRISDRGPGIASIGAVLSGSYVSTTGMGLGLSGARRLADRFEIQSSGEGTTVLIGKRLPDDPDGFRPERITEIRHRLAGLTAENPFGELQDQNQELLRALEEVRRRQAEVERLNLELAETNRGVLALYAELDERAVALHRANELKSRFLSNVTHELRTPLNAIHNVTRLLLDGLDGDLNTEQHRQVGFIHSSANLLTDLVNDLLDLARIEAGKMDLTVKRFTVNDLLAAIRGMFRPLLRPEVTLIMDDSAEPVHFVTDEGKVAQILRNLVSNGLKFTERGEVRVSVRVVGMPSHRPAGRPAVEFVVEDTGPGIPAEEHEAIFEEFNRVRGSSARAPGTGLGLPLSRRLATLLGGSLTVNSEPGQGARFTALIPIEFEAERDG